MTRAKANKERGERELALGGKAYRLRPSFAAIAAIEEDTEKSLLELLRMANVGALNFAQMGTIAAEFIRAGADEADDLTRAVDAERIAELIYEDGVTQTLSVLTLCLLEAVTGGRKASGEAKAPATKRKAAGAA